MGVVMQSIIALFIAVAFLSGCQTTRDPNVIPEAVTRHIAIAGEWEKIALPPPRYANMRFKTSDGCYLNYRPVRRIGGVTILFWDNELIAAMGHGHITYRGDKMLIAARRIRGQHRGTVNEISAFRPICPRLKSMACRRPICRSSFAPTRHRTRI